MTVNVKDIEPGRVSGGPVIRRESPLERDSEHVSDAAVLAFGGQSGVPPREVALAVAELCSGNTSGVAVVRAESGLDDLELLGDTDS